MDKNTEVILDRLEIQGKRQDDMREQLDRDRSKVDQNTIDIDSIKKGQEAILNQMADFKTELRLLVKDVIKEEVSREVSKAVKKAVAQELDRILLENPRKVLIKTVGVWERIVKIFRKDL